MKKLFKINPNYLFLFSVIFLFLGCGELSELAQNTQEPINSNGQPTLTESQDTNHNHHEDAESVDVNVDVDVDVDVDVNTGNGANEETAEGKTNNGKSETVGNETIYLRVEWGKLFIDMDAKSWTVWDGCITLDGEGSISLIKTIAFEYFNGDDYIYEQKDDREFCWGSQTKPHRDGLLMKIEPEDVDDVLTFATDDNSLFVKEFKISELREINEIYDVDSNDYNNTISFIAVTDDDDDCEKGFLTGYWGENTKGDGGNIIGFWNSKELTIKGVLNGDWMEPVEEGENGSFSGTYVNNNGVFQGNLSGEWIPRNGDPAGEFSGTWNDKDNEKIGEIDGHWFYSETNLGGYFSGTWEEECKDK